MRLKISIVICTYNRSKWLKYCIESLVTQNCDKYLFEVIIVNNNSTDDTLNVAKKYRNEFQFYKVVTEKKQGLSFARNRGIDEASAEWVAYIDDDGKVRQDYIEQAIKTIECYNFDCFGGEVRNWFYFGKPKWYPDNMYNKADHKTVYETDYVLGGISFWLKEVFIKYGRFSTNIGMKGDKYGYGEETSLNDLIRANGGKVGCNPLIILDHLVPEYKMKIKWFLKYQYAMSRDATFNYIEVRNILLLIFYYIKTIGGIPYRFLQIIPKVYKSILFKRDYFWQNIIIEILIDFYKKIGRLKGLALKYNETKTKKR